MKLYGGIDLHSNNSYVVIVDEEERVMYEKRLANDAQEILRALAPYQSGLEGLVVESTYNWYWLADALRAENYTVHLANPCAIQTYSGLKYSDDKSDARWLAKLLKLKILKTGYIYPKDQRPLREVLRRRLILVHNQTRQLLSIQGLGARYLNQRWSGNQIKKASKEWFMAIPDPLIRQSINSHYRVLKCVQAEIERLEKIIQKELKPSDDFKRLKSLPGVGAILAMTILLETGEIKRFPSAGDYSSYCRTVKSIRLSNEKKKGENNRKNGNAYLGWAFIEAANVAVRVYKPITRYYQRKLQKQLRVVALKTIANKLSKASYFMLRDKVEFEMKKLFP